MIWLLLLGCRGLTVNDVTTGETPEYPEVRSMFFHSPPGPVFDRAQLVAEQMGWQNCATPEPYVLTCEAVTPTMGFVDDVSVWMVPQGPGMTQLKMRSASRVGKGDFGANARRILAFQEAMVAYEAL